jgi:glycerophosphoryl diester phosphodiesterase
MSAPWSGAFGAESIFPNAGWHRGDVTTAQENTLEAFKSTLQSGLPNIEADFADFIDANGNRVGIMVHECDMERTTGIKGLFMDHHDMEKLPMNSVDKSKPSAAFMTVIDFFEMIKKAKENGVTPVVSMDLKGEGSTGEAFGEWIGSLIKSYGFADHFFASSFEKSNVEGVKKTCPECMTGGLVYNDHWALKYLDYHHTTLDLGSFSKATFFLGFLGKGEYPHDFVLIQDEILVKHPELIDYWKNVRHVKFVGAFSHNKERGYDENEWKVLRKADWLELEPAQIRQYIDMKKENSGQ